MLIDDGIGDACPGDVTIGVDSDGCADTEPHKRYTSQCKSGLLNDCTGATFGDNTAKNFHVLCFLPRQVNIRPERQDLEPC